MKTRSLLLSAVASIALAGSASANGWYVGGEVGLNWIDDVDGTGTVLGFPTSGTTSFDSGWAFMATVGNSFDGGWRIEGEIGYRANDTSSTTAAEVTEWSFMVNLLHDFELSPKLNLSLGVGVGMDQATLDLGGVVDDSDTNFAYQGIVGLSYPIGSETDLTLTYRYLNVQEPSFEFGGIAKANLDDVTKHALTVGFRMSLSPGE